MCLPAQTIETLDKTHCPCRTGTFAISHAATPSNACEIQAILPQVRDPRKSWSQVRQRSGSLGIHARRGPPSRDGGTSPTQAMAWRELADALATSSIAA